MFVIKNNEKNKRVCCQSFLLEVLMLKFVFLKWINERFNRVMFLMEVELEG